MLITNRVVPVLLLRDGLLVKTRAFRRPVYVGDPINAVRIFNDKEVDELVVLDMDPPRTGAAPRFSLLEEIAGEAFMPVAYGGGVASVDTAQRLVGLGMEKIVVTSAALETGLVRRLTEVLGSQAVIGGVDYRERRGRRVAYTDGGRKRTRRSATEQCETLVEQGVGELLLQAIDRDGSMGGMDHEFVSSVAGAVPVPITAVGGAGSVADLAAALRAGASAVGAGSMLVFHGKHRAVLITYPDRRLIAEVLNQ